MKIHIAGSGAMGSLFGYKIAKSGHEVVLLDAWEDHIRAVQENGLTITGGIEDTLNIPMMTPEDAEGTADLMILFTKAHGLPAMLKKTAHLRDKNTQVLSMLNGIGHEDVISQYVPKENIIVGVTMYTASIEKPGVVSSSNNGAINLQALVESPNHTAVEKVTETLNEAQLNATYDKSVFEAIWRKAAVNSAVNPTCTLLDVKIKELFATEDGVNLVKQIISELVQVANHLDINLDEKETIDYVLNAWPGMGEHYPSMHQDLVKNKRQTEIDYINGYVARKGKENNIPVPVNDTITKLIHMKENAILN